MIRVVRYSSEMKSLWDYFVGDSKNSHFMFYRDYMDYHADRFVDHSLMIYDEKNRLIAALPANLNDRVLYSHQGLSFGGLLINKKATTEKVYDLFLVIINYFKKGDIVDSFIYKRVPDFYNKYPAQEDLYSLFLLDAVLIRRDVSVVIDMVEPYTYQEMRNRRVKKARKLSIDIVEEKSLKGYWKLLVEVLQIQHSVKPVHTLDEIELLKSRFPANIKCYAASLNGELLAGVVVYETETVAHMQYIASSVKGRELGALDLVIDHLIKNVYRNKKYFDFGIII